MRYWLLRGKKPAGPYAGPDLLRQPDFEPECLVCPEGLPPAKRKNWKVASKVKELKALLDAPRPAEEPKAPPVLPWEADKTRWVTPPPAAAPEPAAAAPLQDLSPAPRPFVTAPELHPKLARAPRPKADSVPRVPTRRETPPLSNLAAGLVSFSVIFVLGTLALLFSGRCSGRRPDAAPPPQERKLHILPAPPDP
ncbi:MAG: hypothetical protein HY553_08465 [Elusimicrobia bacterium]|nr:hypothetical protein [Elusimicrobiota bacterium]